jgi:hypothetical protein
MSAFWGRAREIFAVGRANDRAAQERQLRSETHDVILALAPDVSLAIKMVSDMRTTYCTATLNLIG